MTATQQLAERLDRVFGAMPPFGVFVADLSKIDIDQLRDLRPGRILLCEAPDAVTFIPAGEAPTMGCIAGWISEDEQ